MFKSTHLCLLLGSLLWLLVLSTTNVFAAKVDPTRPLNYTASSATAEGQKMVLESLIHGTGVRTAVISGKVLKVGDKLGEYQLTEVNENSVILQSATERIELNIFKKNLVKESVKQ